MRWPARACCFVVVGLASVACTGDPEGVTLLAPSLSVTETSRAFGEVFIGHVETASILVVNAGDAPLTFSSLRIEGDPSFALASATPGQLPPTGAVFVPLTFTPIEEGPRTARLTLATDGGDAVVELSGTGLSMPHCEDPRPCREAAFDVVLGVCVSSPREGACALDDPCIDDATCFEGSCFGLPRVCPSPGGCVVTTCDAVDGCLSLPHHAACDLDENPCTRGVCRDDGTCEALIVEDLTPCADTFSCEEGVRLCVDGACTAFAAEGLPCHDGDLCTVGDLCAADTCAAGAASTTTAVELVDVLPVLSDYPRDLGDRLVSKSALGVLVTDGVSGAVSIAHVLADVPCLQGTMHRLSASRFVCVSTAEAPRPLLVVDQQSGSVVETIFAPPESDGTVRSFHWDSAFANGALYTTATGSFSEGVLVRIPVVDGGLGVPQPTLATLGGRVALGDRYFVDHDPYPPFGAVSLPRVIDVTGEEPVEAFQSLVLAQQDFVRTSLGFALVRGTTFAFLVDLEDATPISANGTPVLASPSFESIQDLRRDSVDLVDGYLVGLRLDEDVVEARPLTEGAPAIEPIAIPGIQGFVRMGRTTFSLGAGRALVFDAATGFSVRTIDLPTGQPRLVRRATGVGVIVDPRTIDGLASVDVRIDDTLAFGALSRADPDQPPEGEALLVDESGLVAPSIAASGRADQIRVVTEQGGVWTTHGTMPTTPETSRLGAVGHTLVEHHFEAGTLTLRTVSVVGGVVDVGAPQVVALRTAEDLAPILDLEGTIDTEAEWASTSVFRSIALDPDDGRIVVASQLSILKDVFDPSPPDEAAPPLTPPAPRVHLRRALVEVWQVAAGAPTLATTHIATNTHDLANTSTRLLVAAGAVMLYRNGNDDEASTGAWTSTWILDLSSPDAPHGPFEVNAVPLSAPNFLLDHGPTAVTAAWGTSVRRQDLVSGEDEELFTLPETPTGVVVKDGAIFVSGATTLSLLRPACALD